MTNDVLEHLKAIKRELAENREIVKECKAHCEKQTEIVTELKETIITQANKIRDLEVDIQILKDGGNI